MANPHARLSFFLSMVVVVFGQKPFARRLRDKCRVCFVPGVGTERHDGTWPASAANLPTLNDAQVLKLKQLTVVALAEGASTLPYEAMMTHLEVPTVRQLEDLLINDCMYTGIVRGKLDQQKRCLEVHYAAGRDIRPGQLVKMLATLKSWTTTSQQLLHTIDDKVKWAGEQSAERVKHKEALEARVEDKKKKIKVGLDCARLPRPPPSPALF